MRALSAANIDLGGFALLQVHLSEETCPESGQPVSQSRTPEIHSSNEVKISSQVWAPMLGVVCETPFFFSLQAEPTSRDEQRKEERRRRQLPAFVCQTAEDNLCE